MANVKISALPAATSVAAADVLPIVQSATTKKATFTDVAGAVGGVRVYASAAARNSAIASPAEGMMVYLTDVNVLQIYTGTGWCTVTPQGANNNTAYTYNPADVGNNFYGPGGNATVTVATGTSALITVGAMVYAPSTRQWSVGVEISGASSISATDEFAAYHQSAGYTSTASVSFVRSGLTAGNNTFKVVVKGADGSYAQTVYRHWITVTGIPS
jgi:hypothetical protein